MMLGYSRHYCRDPMIVLAIVVDVDVMVDIAARLQGHRIAKIGMVVTNRNSMDRVDNNRQKLLLLLYPNSSDVNQEVVVVVAVIVVWTMTML